MNGEIGLLKRFEKRERAAALFARSNVARRIHRELADLYAGRIRRALREDASESVDA